MNVFKSLMQPPGLQILLLVIALVCWFRFRHLSFWLVAVSCLSLYLLSTGFVANALMKGLEAEVDNLPGNKGAAQAIVILGTGVLGNTPEYDNEPQPSALLAQRLRYGLKLGQDTGLPVLVTGGSRFGINEAEVMTRFFEDHNFVVRWREPDSFSTRDNARNSAAILLQQGMTSVLLVSHAWHLPRARRAFEKAGFDVIPAPTAFASSRRSRTGLSAWLPDIRELRNSQLALHEYAGIFWYVFFDR